MKRVVLLFVMLCLLFAGAGHLLAQQVVTGQVTDKGGNPISGARVEGKGANVVVTTGIDGRFRLETPIPIQKVRVSSAGKNTKEQYVSANTVVVLSDPTWLTSQATRYRWFVSPQIAFLGADSKDTPLGLAAGVVKNVGGYAKVMFSPMPSAKYTDSAHDSGFYFYGDGYKTGFFSATAGTVLRLWSPFHLMLGAGYAKRKVAVQHISGEYIEVLSYSDNHKDEVKVSTSGFAAEAMLMTQFGHFTASAGTTLWSTDNSYFSFNLGVGYMF